MKKYFPAFLVVLSFLFITCLPVQAAARAVWSIEWNSDNSLNETVIIQGHNVVIEDNEWKTFRSGQELTLTRHIKDWEEYSNFNDRIPLKVEEKDFWLIKFSSLTLNEEIIPGSLYEQFKSLAGSSLSIEVPGIIRESSATTRGDSLAAWTLNDNQVIKLDAVVFDGVVLGISFFALGSIIIFLIFLNRIKRVNRLIAQEYSLERAAEEFARGEIDEQAEKP